MVQRKRTERYNAAHQLSKKLFSIYQFQLAKVDLAEVNWAFGVEHDGRTGLPWGMTQDEFDLRNANHRNEFCS